MANNCSNSPKETIKIVDKIREKIKIKEEDFVVWKVAKETNDPFKILIATLLSQNTTDKNALKAFWRLEEEIGVEPEKLAFASIKKIGKAIKIAGLHRIKAEAIKELSQIILKEYQGDLWRLLKSENSREKLLSLPRVGNKTADVLLLMLIGRNVIPVDTHIRRIALRLGVSNQNSYTSIQRGLMKFFKDENMLELHLCLIALGKTYCKPRKPKCNECPLADICKYRRLIFSENH